MNLQSENKSQRNSAVEMLTKRNAEAVSKMELTPYEPQVYAIPIDQRSEEFRLLKEAVTFQPTLYQQIKALATRQEMEYYISEIQEIKENYMQKTISEIQSLIKQDGKNREKFISQCSSVLAGANSQLSETIAKLHRKIIGIMIGTSVAAIALSVLVSVVFWRLAA